MVYHRGGLGYAREGERRGKKHQEDMKEEKEKNEAWSGTAAIQRTLPRLVSGRNAKNSR